MVCTCAYKAAQIAFMSMLGAPCTDSLAHGHRLRRRPDVSRKHLATLSPIVGSGPMTLSWAGLFSGSRMVEQAKNRASSWSLAITSIGFPVATWPGFTLRGTQSSTAVALPGTRPLPPPPLLGSPGASIVTRTASTHRACFPPALGAAPGRRHFALAFVLPFRSLISRS